jgi:hypothetical protein
VRGPGSGCLVHDQVNVDGVRHCLHTQQLRRHPSRVKPGMPAPNLPISSISMTRQALRERSIPWAPEMPPSLSSPGRLLFTRSRPVSSAKKNKTHSKSWQGIKCRFGANLVRRGHPGPAEDPETRTQEDTPAKDLSVITALAAGSVLT